MLEDLHIREPYDGFIFMAESVRNPPVLKPHRHVELELNLVVGGEIRYVVEDRSYHFTAGSLVWIFPGQVHQLVDRSPGAAYYVTVFRPDRMKELEASARYRSLLEELPPKEGVLHHRPTSANFQMLRHIMAELCAGGMDPDLLNREAGFGVSPGFHYEHSDPMGLNAGLRYLCLRAWRMTEEGQRENTLPPLHPAVRKALEKLRTSDPPLRLPELARHCGVSASTLSRLFRTQMGIPLNRYRNSVMLSRFMEYMSGGQPTILEAVHAAGFGSYAQFHRVFRDAYRQSPREALRAPAKGAVTKTRSPGAGDPESSRAR